MRDMSPLVAVWSGPECVHGMQTAIRFHSEAAQLLQLRAGVLSRVQFEEGSEGCIGSEPWEDIPSVQPLLQQASKGRP
jgi:hypothetical protein